MRSSDRGYDLLTDGELIDRYRSGEEEAVTYLLEKYKKLVRVCARPLFLVGGDREDLIQEGMLGLYRAVREYDVSRGASFQTFAGMLINRQMYDAVAAAGRKKHEPLNFSVSLSEVEAEWKQAGAASGQSPEMLVLDREKTEELLRAIEERLSPFERRVLDRYMEGEDYQTIAERLGRSAKSIDNALQRIRTKIASFQS